MILYNDIAKAIFRYQHEEGSCDSDQRNEGREHESERELSELDRALPKRFRGKPMHELPARMGVWVVRLLILDDPWHPSAARKDLDRPLSLEHIPIELLAEYGLRPGRATRV